MIGTLRFSGANPAEWGNGGVQGCPRNDRSCPLQMGKKNMDKI